jgi:hypothetical protein
VALPPLLSSRPPAHQIVVANVVPALYGLITGVLLGVSEPVYLVLSLLGILGGYVAGLEHPTAGDGATRGVVGGVLFGSFILLGHEMTGAEAKAELPEPAILLVAITTVFGALLGALGGRSRAKRTPAAAS